MEPYGIPSKSSMQKMTSHGHSGIGTAKWEPFMKSVWPQIKRMTFQNSLIKNCSEIPKKTSFRKEKSNLKTITILFYPLSTFKNFLICFNSSTGPNQRRKKKFRKSHWTKKKTSKVKSTNKFSLEKSSMKSRSKPNQSWSKLTTLITKSTIKLAKSTIQSSRKWS